MVQRIKHFGAELQLETFRQLEHFDEPEIEVPVVRRRKDVSAGTILSRRRQTEGLRQINAASGHVSDWLEENGTREWRVWQVLKLRLNRKLYSRARFVTSVRSERSAANGKRLTGHESENAVNGPTAQDLVYKAMGGAEELSSVAKRHFPDRGGLQNMRPIKIRATTFFAEVANVSRCARVGGGQAATG